MPKLLNEGCKTATAQASYHELAIPGSILQGFQDGAALSFILMQLLAACIIAQKAIQCTAEIVGQLL